MANFLYIPELNPVKLVDMSPTVLPQYLSKMLEDYRYADTLREFQEQVFYSQKYQTSDVIYLQFESNFDPIQVQLIDENGAVRVSLNATQKLLNIYQAGFYVYEATISLASIPPGLYYVKVLAGSKTLISEPICVQTTHEKTILFEYWNTKYHQDVIFETGIHFSFRCEAMIGFLNPGNQEVVYEDQKLNPTVISSRPFSSFKLWIGSERGIPDWVIKKMNYIWSCNSVLLDGHSYAKNSDAKLEIKEEDGYPMRGLAFDIREGINRGSKIISPDVDTTKKISVAYQMDSRIFGDLTNPGSNLVPLISTD